jgi:hypothetical protein
LRYGGRKIPALQGAYLSGNQEFFNQVVQRLKPTAAMLTSAQIKADVVRDDVQTYSSYGVFSSEDIISAVEHRSFRVLQFIMENNPSPTLSIGELNSLIIESEAGLINLLAQAPLDEQYLINSVHSGSFPTTGVLLSKTPSVSPNRVATMAASSKNFETAAQI